MRLWVLRVSICTGLIAAASPNPAHAGPWPREAGQAFLSFSSVTSMDRMDRSRLPEYDAALYGELGVGRRLTFGTDLYHGPTDFSHVAFVRRPITRAAAKHQVAVSVGFGQQGDGTRTDTLWLAGLHWGTGFDTRWGGAWTTVDAQIRRPAGGGDILKLDATLGVKPGENWMIYGQIQAAHYPGTDRSAMAEVSLVRKIGKRFSLQTGLVYGIRNDTRAGVKLGLWTEF